MVDASCFLELSKTSLSKPSIIETEMAQLVILHLLVNDSFSRRAGACPLIPSPKAGELELRRHVKRLCEKLTMGRKTKYQKVGPITARCKVKQ